MARITIKEFTSSGSWTCPAGVTKILTIGCGGGAGGSGALTAEAGGGSEAVLHVVDVVPNTSYTITIGAGGAGVTTGDGGRGTDTTLGALVTWNRAGDIRSTEPYAGSGMTQTYRDGDYGNGCGGGPAGGLGQVGGPSNRFDGGAAVGSDPGGGAGGFGDGGDANSTANGTSGAANSGAGGGATSAPYTGGSGGTGYLQIIWSE